MYAKIPAEIGISKLSPQSIKYILIGYFGHGTYKLWDQASGTTIKSHDVIFEEGQGHHTITAPTVSFDSTLDDGDALPPFEASNFNPSGVIVPPKPLAPRPHATDPPPHANSAQNEPVQPITDTLPTTPPPVVLRRSAHLATVNVGVTIPQTTALMTGLPETYIPQNYKEAMVHPDLWMPAMETEWAVLAEREVFRLVDPPPGAHIIKSMCEGSE